MAQTKTEIKGEQERSSRTTLWEFVAQAQPFSWNNRSSMDLKKWFQWPPDIFALTSLLLSHTGAYRHAVSPLPGKSWPDDGWTDDAQELGHKWRNWVSDGCPENSMPTVESKSETKKDDSDEKKQSDLKKPKSLEEYMKILREYDDVKIDELYDCTSEESWKLCKALLELHGIADEAMRGVGIIFNPRTTIKITAKRKSLEISDHLSSFYLKANFLLALRGSLSRIPKYRGVVIPKSRTPQVGFTMRSFSNNITFHQTEVDVAWRTFPWFNFDENTVNIIIIPWPFEVNANFFSPVYHPKVSSQVGSDRYFHYEPKTKAFDSDKIVHIIRETKKEARHIHMLVFPEMALSRKELNDIKLNLERNFKPHDIPMIISGVSDPFEVGNDITSESDFTQKDQTKKNFQASQEAVAYNRTVLSVYFAGKWHDTLQDKHHRWKIDGNQIEQYQLGGVLSGLRTWWEGIQISRRRLSVLAANSWLTICPLICEDLARLEPVSDLIRGIGPTLLTALLLDGPQLKERWSARYASVLADDPGTSVLTLTALGMSKRSVIPGTINNGRGASEDKNAGVVGFWKDQEKGWQPLTVDKNSDFPNTMLTISALWKNEVAFDGRTEEENAAVFAYQGLFYGKDIEKTEHKNSTPQVKGQEDSDDQNKKRGDSPENIDVTKSIQKDDLVYEVPRQKQKKEKDAERKKLSVLDMCELTLFTYYTDAIIDTKSSPELLYSWFQNAVGIIKSKKEKEKEEKEEQDSPSKQTEKEIIRLLRDSIEKRDLVPREVPTPHLNTAITILNEYVEKAQNEFKTEHEDTDISSDKGYIEYWKILKRISVEGIHEISELFRMKKDAPNSTKYADFVQEMTKFKEKNDRFLKAHWKTDKLKGSKKIVQFKLREYGRLKLSIPLSILWALHSRLSTKRRFGVLSYAGATLLKQIEKEIDEGDYHDNFREWRDAMKDEEKRSSKAK